VEIGGRLRVRPPWEPALARSGLVELVVDPGQAFGTGAHPTTRLCLELLLELEPRGSFVDLGCGSGVLALAAARLGFAPVAAVDSEAAAVEATLANARANGIALDRVTRTNLREEPAPHAEVAAANLVRPLLLDLAAATERPPRVLLASGLLEGEVVEVVAAFGGMREVRRTGAQGWSALMLLRRAYT
jgi:ribosomal protein L11 methyltransferase